MTEAAHEAGDDQLATTGHPVAITPGQAALSGLRHPLVGILLLIGLCSAISGKPLDGALMATVALLLAWDAARARQRYWSEDQTAHPTRTGPRRRPARLVAATAGVAAAAAYATIVGGFSRYSWPVTVGVVALGCLMVAIGWQGPVRSRPVLTGRPLRRVWLWALVLVAGGGWELSSLLQQPHLTTDSYAHPTISALSDPVLASHPGRTVFLGGWLALGWFLAGR
ncbi:MAG TPA: hypothetical protein VEV45_22405 [Streptosporangiaceae bacterium]|nr:hypothetical protein [Streptosporangiaceae bacterium]